MSDVIRKEQDFILGSNGHAGLSNRKAAELLKVDEKTIRNALKGTADIFSPEEIEMISLQGFQGADLLKLTRYYEKNNRVSTQTRKHCSSLIDQAATIGFQGFIDMMAGIQPVAGQTPKETGAKNISTSNAVKLLDELKQSLQVLSEQLEAGHALLKAGNGMVRSLHNAIHNQGSSLNQADRFLKKAQAQIGEMEKALSNFDEGTLMVEQTTITRVIVQRPQDVRRKIEDFLDYLVTLSPEDYQKLFLEVPNLTNRERKYGRFSTRTIARYLGLAPGQDRTISNIMQERGWKP